MLTFRQREHPLSGRLKAIDQFKGCSESQLRKVARFTDEVEVPRGEVLVREDEFGRELFLILSGRVSVTQNGCLVNSLGSGDFFGELAALNFGPRNATVTAASDLDLLLVGRRHSRTMLEIPEFRDALLKSMAKRLQTMDQQAAAIAGLEKRAGRIKPVAQARGV